MICYQEKGSGPDADFLLMQEIKGAHRVCTVCTDKKLGNSSRFVRVILAQGPC